MNISITGPDGAADKRFQKAARRQLIRAFGNYSSSIVSIQAEHSDVHSDHEELQRHCCIVLHLLGSEAVTSEAWDENPLAAVIRAADRARQKMISQIARPRQHTV